MSCAELVAEDANSPDVNHFVIFIAHDYLWGDVVEGATESGPFGAK